MAHTKDLGIAIRDALELLDGVEVIAWGETGDAALLGTTHEISDIDASDADNLLVTLDDGSTFRVRITREG